MEFRTEHGTPYIEHGTPCRARNSIQIMEFRDQFAVVLHGTEFRIDFRTQKKRGKNQKWVKKAKITKTLNGQDVSSRHMLIFRCKKIIYINKKAE